MSETKILRSVEAAGSAWWGYAHAEPTHNGKHPPIDQLRPTHVALRGAVPDELRAQAITIRGDRCPCCAGMPVAVVPVGATWPAGTVLRHDTLERSAAAYADAG